MLPYVEKRLAENWSPVFYPGKEPTSERKVAGDYLDCEIPVVLASVLLDRGYGTGEYRLYGRAFLDLDTMTITDDRKAPYPDGASL